MNTEPRHSEDYSERQVEAARRTLVDIHQVLASYQNCLVLVGGWVPYLLLPEAEEPHVGSIDVDLALNTEELRDGRYSEMLSSLLATGRYRNGVKEFQFIATVDLADGQPPVQVAVEFLAPREAKLKKNRPRLMPDFRVLLANGCAAAFRAPEARQLSGRMIHGAANTVQLRVASLPDFLVMKAHAIRARDKPKDTYDFCYCLANDSRALDAVAANWKSRKSEPDVATAIAVLRERFAGVDSFGPQQVVEFYDAIEVEERQIQARRAFELVSRLLQEIDE